MCYRCNGWRQGKMNNKERDSKRNVRKNWKIKWLKDGNYIGS